MSVPRPLSALALSLVLAAAPGCGVTRTTPVDTPLYTSRYDPARIQALVEDLKARLPIAEDVEVTIVPSNPLMVSAESSNDRPGAFLLRLEADFLASLTNGELEAVLAHELGHIWIFTHHPYLQTEALANRIAMRLVTRESLVRVYEKVWKSGGAKGDLAGFLGLSQTAATTAP